MVGCAATRKNIGEMVEEDKLNAQTSRMVARQILATWKLNGSFLTQVNKDFGKSLPCECQANIDLLMKYADECLPLPDGEFDCSKVTDDKLGATLYLWGKTWYSISRSVVGEIINKVMPSLFAQFAKYSAILIGV